MSQRYLRAAWVGVLGGVALLLSHLILAVAGFAGNFLIPFFGCALGCIGWLLIAAFLVGLGWYAANDAWATRTGDAIGVAMVAGLTAGIVSQCFNLVLGLALSLVGGAVGAVLGYYLANGYNPLAASLLGGLAGLVFVLLITLVQFACWVGVSTLLGAIGGVMYLSKSR